jgi:hypothetical protein
VSLLHSLQFVGSEVSEQSLKIHIRKQQPPRPRVLMHFVGPLPLPLGSSRFGRHERLSRRSFMVGAAVFFFAVPSY